MKTLLLLSVMTFAIFHNSEAYNDSILPAEVKYTYPEIRNEHIVQPISKPLRGKRATDSLSSTPSAEDITIYIAGGEEKVLNFGPSMIVPKYWKNGKAVVLEHPVRSNSEVKAIAVSGKDVHTVGWQYDRSKPTLEIMAMYWKNGKAIPLSDGTNDTQAISIVVNGEDVHILGMELSSDNESNPAILYWKNGVLTRITEGKNLSQPTAMTVDGDDVYIAGYEFKESCNTMDSCNGNFVAKYWKNGKATHLTDGNREAEAKSIAVNNGDIYVAGYEEAQRTAGNRVAKLWKNGTAISISKNDAQVISMAVDSGDIHMIVRETLKTETGFRFKYNYIKNEVMTELGIEATSVAVKDGDVYICGTRSGKGGKSISVYMKNGVVHNLTKGKVVSEANSIIVVKE